MAKPLIVITGPTASGKTRRAVDVARRLEGEIVSADSRQIYRGMDLGTGKEQKITITASTNLSQDEIDKAMHEAEQYAEQDKKNKEAVEVRNNAEQLVFQSEKALTDLGDKLSADEKSGVQAEIEKVKEALKGTDTDMIKAATEGLSKKFSDLAGKIYQQQAPQGNPNMGGQPGAGAQGGSNEAYGDDVVDGDYREV